MKNRRPNQIRRTPKILSLTGLILLGSAVAAALAQQAPVPTQSSQPHQPASTQSPAYGGSSFQLGNQNHEQQLLQLEHKFQSISKRITTAQEKAAQNAAVKKKQDTFEKAMYKKMAQSAPDKKTQIQQFRKLGKELQSSADLRKPAFERSKSFDQKLSKYQKLYAQLGPIERQVAKDQQVVKLRTAYVQSLMAEMKQIEPQTDSLLRQRQQLIQTIRSLQSQQSTPPTVNTQRPAPTTTHNKPAKGWQQPPPSK